MTIGDGCEDTCQPTPGYSCHGSPSYCAPSDQVIIVGPSGADYASLSEALDDDPQDASVIFLEGFTDAGNVIFDQEDFVVVGEAGTIIAGDTDGPAITILESDVSLLGVTVRHDQNGNGNHGIRIYGDSNVVIERCHVGPTDQIGIYAGDNAGSLVINRCTITGNDEGGMRIDAAGNYSITNNFIVQNGYNQNGNNGSPFGGVRLERAGNFSFNTVADNDCNSLPLGATCGIICDVNNTDIDNSIIYDNLAAEYNGLCDVAGNGNLSNQGITGVNNGNPRFVGGTDFHIASDSAAIDQVGGGVTGVDYDGDPRDIGGSSDIGADEYVP